MKKVKKNATTLASSHALLHDLGVLDGGVALKSERL